MMLVELMMKARKKPRIFTKSFFFKGFYTRPLLIEPFLARGSLISILFLLLIFLPACQEQPVVGAENNSAPIALMSYEPVEDGMEGIIYRQVNRFETFLAQSDIPVLVVFYHPLADINTRIIPRLEQLADDEQGRLAILWVNANEETTLMENFQVTTLPQFTVVEDSSIRRSLVGYDDQAYENLLELVEPYLAD